MYDARCALFSLGLEQGGPLANGYDKKIKFFFRKKSLYFCLHEQTYSGLQLHSYWHIYVIT